MFILARKNGISYFPQAATAYKEALIVVANSLDMTIETVTSRVASSNRVEKDIEDNPNDVDEDFINHSDNKLNLIQLRKIFNQNLEFLTPKQKYVLFSRFGIGTTVKTLEHLGEVLGVTRERVRQIESQTIRIIKNNKSLINILLQFYR